MAKKVTMQDIADKLGISKNSVSQALTGKPGVSASTRQLIEETATQMGYQYSINKKKDMEESTKTIALLASDFAFSQTGFFGEIYLAIEKEVKARGMQLVIQSIDNETRDDLSLPTFIKDRTVAGVLVLSHISREYINALIGTGIPTVMIDHHDPFNEADAVLVNNRFAAYKAVYHLLELGHTQIGFLADINVSPSYLERFEGYKLALRDAGIEPRKEWMLTHVKEASESVNHALATIKDRPTAWFCSNDGFGFMTLMHWQSKGIKVPEQISVVSFDNGQLSQISSPKTTTMDINLQHYGAKAIEQLCWRMDHPDRPVQEILLHAELVVRESSGKPLE